MNKALLIVKAGLLFCLLATTVYYHVGCSGRSNHNDRTINYSSQNITVKISMNLDKDNSENAPWYWTQLHLPPHGELMLLSSQEEYDKYWKKDGEASIASIFKTRQRNGVKYIGMFCCAETIPERYVFIPKDGLDRDKLLFFAPDDKVWIIPIPETLRTKQKGEISTIAEVY
jgi:hypothetical protein